MSEEHGNPCPLCGESKPNAFRIYFDGYLKLYRCLSCGFVAQYPGPGGYTVVTDYEDAYTLEFVKQGREFIYPQRRRCLLDIADRIAALKPHGKLLDVGSGDGHFLHVCAGKGFECFGVEPSKTLAPYSETKTGAKVLQGMYEKDMFPESTFDAITFIQVLEHIPTPIPVLDAVRYHLKPGGLVVVEIPSIRSPHFLAYQMTGIKWFVKPPDGVIPSHCSYFSPQTLQALVEKVGFRTVSLVTGRWQHKYKGVCGQIGKMLDPFFNKTRIGGIVLIAEKT